MAKKVYVPSKEAVERHNKRISKIEKKTEELEKSLEDTYLESLKKGTDEAHTKAHEKVKKVTAKKTKSIALPESEIKKIKQRAKKRAESKYKKNIFKKRVKRLIPNEGEPKWAAPLGAAVLGAVVVIGVIVGVVIYKSQQFKIPTAEQKAYYEKLTAPAVLFDETGFETIGTASDNYIILTGLWQEYLDNKNNLATDDYGSFVIPFEDVLSQSKEVFGNYSKKVEPFNAAYGNITFNWDEEHQYFVIPSSGYPSDITPEVIGIKDKKDKTILKVNYLSAGENGEWEVIEEKEITVIADSSGNEYIYSIQ